MHLEMGIYSDFFDNYDEVRDYVYSCDFKNLRNPSDDVVYESTCVNIKPEIKQECQTKLERLVGQKVHIKTLILRKSDKNKKQVGAVHTDTNMAQYNLIVYFNDVGGTSILSHTATGLHSHPKNQEELDIYYRDKYNYTAWMPLSFCPARQNQACILNSSLMHRAEPPVGFGEGLDARMVLVAFFDVVQ